MRLCWSCLWGCGKVSRVCSAVAPAPTLSDKQNLYATAVPIQACGRLQPWQPTPIATTNKLWSYRKVTIITPVPSIDLNFCWPNFCLLLNYSFGKAMMTIMMMMMMMTDIEMQIHNCFYHIYLNLNCHLYKYSRDFRCISFYIYLGLIIRNPNVKFAHNRTHTK